MPRLDPLYVWTRELTTAFPDLSKPQLKGLAHWSFGMILARCCSLDSVASYMADWLEQPELSVRSRLREWYLPADRKSVSSCGDKRKDLPVHTCFAPLLDWLLNRQGGEARVHTCFAPLLDWLLRDWPEPRLALALDASTLADRF